MRKLLWILVLALIALMPMQWSVHVGGMTREIHREFRGELPDNTANVVRRTDIKHEGGVNVTPGDALLVVVFVVWAASVIAASKFREVRWPAAAVFVFLAVLLASALHSDARWTSLGKFAQFALYFGAGWLVFANCIDTRERLRAAVGLFTLVVSGIVLLALWQYYAAARGGSAFDVSGTFGNRNVLGAFMAMSLPFVFALGLWEERLWQRFALFLLVGFGAMVTLSGGALIALGAGLLVVAAMRSGRAVLGVSIAIALAVTVLPGTLALQHHSNVVVNSVSPYVKDNFLDPRAKLHDKPVPAVRYMRWYANVRLIRKYLVWPFLGVGPGRYNGFINECYGDVDKPGGATDAVAEFNITTNEPDSFNMYLVTCAEGGPLALLALVAVGLAVFGRSIRARFVCPDEFGQSLAAGAVGALAGGAVCGVFTNLMVRGVALPFIFVLVSGILWPKLPDSAEPE